MGYLRARLAPAVVVYVVVAMAHLATLGFIAHVAHSRGATVAEYVGGDIPNYIALGNRLLDDGTFRNIDTGLPETFRTPGYPSFIAVILAFSGRSVVALLILQALLLSLVGVMVYLICRELLLPVRHSAIAGVICGISPGMIGLTLGSVGGDALYTLLLLCATYVALRLRLHNNAYLIAAGVGVILGIATLIRPVGLYLVPLFGLSVAAFAFVQFGSKKRAALFALTTLLAASLVLLPWYIRNKVQTEHFILTSLPAFNLTWYNIPAFLSYTHGTTDSIERTKVLTALGNPVPITLYSYTMTDTLTAYDTAFFEEHLFSYIPFHMVKTIPFFVSSGLRDDTLVLQGMGVRVPLSPNNDNLTSLLLHGRIREIAFHLVEFWPFALESLGWALLFLLAFSAPLFSSTLRTRALLILSACIILVSAGLTGPVAQARYRVPIEPYVWIGATYAVWRISERMRSRLARLY